MRSDHDRLRDVLECAERIARHEQLGEPEDLVLDAILHNLVVIGEAVRGLSEGCCEREPGVRWSAIVRMRNLLAHEYFRVEYSHVRDVIEVYVPDLADAARRLLSALGETDKRSTSCPSQKRWQRFGSLRGHRGLPPNPRPRCSGRIGSRIDRLRRGATRTPWPGTRPGELPYQFHCAAPLRFLVWTGC
jgi:uncharacterized protein with HEPN domain